MAVSGNVGPLNVDVQRWQCVLAIVRGVRKRVKCVDQVGDSGRSIDDRPVWEACLETDFPEGGDDIGQRVSISSCVARCGGECSCCHVELNIQ